MKEFLYMFSALMIMVLGVTLLSSLGKSDGPDNGTQTDKTQDEISISLDVNPHQATPGDTVWFVLSVFNHTQDSTILRLPSPLPARFTVYRGEKPVWNSDYGMMFAQIITPLTITPGDSLPIKAFWFGKDNHTEFLPLGKYFIEACFLANKKCLKDTVWLVD